MARVFDPKADRAIRKRRSRAFQVLFDLTGPLGDEAELVLAALREFCRAQASTTGETDQATYVLNGRRDVWLFLMEQLNFDDKTIRNLTEATDDFFNDE